MPDTDTFEAFQPALAAGDQEVAFAVAAYRAGIALRSAAGRAALPGLARAGEALMGEARDRLIELDTSGESRYAPLLRLLGTERDIYEARCKVDGAFAGGEVVGPLDAAYRRAWERTNREADRFARNRLTERGPLD